MAGERANPNDTSHAFNPIVEDLGAGVIMDEPQDDFLSQEAMNPQFGAIHEPELEGVSQDDSEGNPTPQENGVDEIPSGVDNPLSFKYFQSKYTKEQERARQLEAQVQQMQAQMQALAQQRQPFPSNGQPGVNQHNPALGSAGFTQEQQNLLQRPEAPKLPDDFDETDAFFDPESESYKARIAQMQYLERMGSYVDQRLAQMDQVFASMAMREQERAREQAWKTQLQDTFQMDQSEQAAFFDMLNDPEMLTLPNMVKIFRALHGGQMAQPQQRQPRMPLPPTPSSRAPSGAREQARSPIDQIMDTMLRDTNPADIAFKPRGN